MAKYIDAEQLIKELYESKGANLSCPLRQEDLGNPDINNYDCGSEETFGTIIKMIEGKLPDAREKSIDYEDECNRLREMAHNLDKELGEAIRGREEAEAKIKEYEFKLNKTKESYWEKEKQLNRAVSQREIAEAKSDIYRGVYDWVTDAKKVLVESE